MPFLGERPKGKYCQTVRMDQVGLKLYQDWEMSFFKMNPHSKPILIEHPEYLASETRKCLSTLHYQSPFLALHLSSKDIVSTKIYDKHDNFNLKLPIPILDGDVCALYPMEFMFLKSSV